jgi:hypothetical protein
VWAFAGPIKFIDRLPGAAEVIGADCDIPAENPALLPASFQAGCAFLAPPTNSNVGATYAIDVQCNSIGVGTVTLVHSPNDSYVLDASANPHVDKGTDVLTINCVPPDGELQINAVDSGIPTKKLSGTCWLISAKQMVQPNPSSPPVSQNSPKDVVSDNNAIAPCDAVGPISKDLSDNNPAVGQIDITISGVNRAVLGDVWHVQNVLSPPKYDNDITKNVCTIGVNDTCQVQVQFDRLFGNAFIEFNNTSGDPIGPPAFAAQCVDVSTKPVVAPVGNFCDNGPGDLDPASGTMDLALPVGAYTITVKTSPAGGQLQGPAAINCDLSGTTTSNQSCAAKYTFSFGEINVSVFSKNVPVAGRCVNLFADPPTNAVPYTPAKVCDGGVGDNDGVSNGVIEISVGAGAIGVKLQTDKTGKDAEQLAVPKQTCVISPTAQKCDVRFDIGAPHNLKTPTLANLFLTAQGTKLPPNTCAESTNFQTFTWSLKHLPVTQSPKFTSSFGPTRTTASSRP